MSSGKVISAAQKRAVRGWRGCRELPVGRPAQSTVKTLNGDTEKAESSDRNRPAEPDGPAHGLQSGYWSMNCRVRAGCSRKKEDAQDANDSDDGQLMPEVARHGCEF